MATASQKTTNPVDQVSGRAHDAVDRAAAAASSVAERFSEQVDSLTEKGDELLGLKDEWVEDAREYVREHPLQALGMAVAAGYLLSMLMRSR
jgi:ElaB/YqjD/DUF883 family membrane-anchored ribosome-binding protein